MKIVHTSDWHVGRLLRGRSRSDEHQAVLAEIAGITEAEQADVVLVCGDLFDTATPTPESERIVYGALLALAATGATVVVLAGNHDNARRLQAVEPLLDLGHIVTRPHFLPAADGGVVEVRARDGGERAKIAVLPFLSQRHVVTADALMLNDHHEHHSSYDARVRWIIATLCESFEPTTVNLVAAHLTVKGGLLGGGERAAHTVFEYEVGALGFPATAQYVALGHLHRSQVVPGPCPIRYCGSPLQLDFGEVDDRKSVLVIDAAPGVPAKVRTIELEAGRRLRTIAGSVADLEALAGTTGDDYLKVVVRAPARVGLADEIRDLFPHAVDVVVEPPGAATEPSRTVPSRRGRSPVELFVDYLADREVADPALEALFREVHEEVAG